MPYIVEGQIEQCWGVEIDGVEGPNTAIEEAKNTFGI